VSYAHDVVGLRHGKIDDGSIRFSRTAGAPRTARERADGDRGTRPLRSGLFVGE
jgi:hypothetical protein